MRNVPIAGGRLIGPPKGWDPATQGECLSISVLQAIGASGPECTTAWQLDEVELNALAAGGHLFVADVLPFIHLRRMFVQDGDGEAVGELFADQDGVHPADVDKTRARMMEAVNVAASLRAAVIAIGRPLEAIVAGPPQDQDWQGAGNAEIVQRLAELVERVGARFGIQRIPILTLDQVARANLGKGKPFPGEPVDPQVQRDLEAMLGVELNPRRLPNSAEVLEFIDTFAGLENDAEEVRDFVQAAARLLARRKDGSVARLDEWASDDHCAGFLAWLEERG